ncbi:hypothetical protein HYC85_008830 [Camellia sinensis]|uniref:Vacuolar ATPase assembly protein VMA22 n=1 Tax=Camellia sinensis TaxID=4442 RepID=A0A7J7HV71_CAMSI|nr:hypothetical protein HYC85_008830 [Camellia sinensis]
MAEEEGTRNIDNGRYSTQQQQQQQEEEEEEGGEREGDQKVVKFLDSVDSYLTLVDSLSSTLRQGWLELAGARHSMGASRISSALFDLKSHCAATTLQITEDGVDSRMKQPNFTLCKWVSPDNRNCSSDKAKFDEDESLQRTSTKPQLRYRGTSVLEFNVCFLFYCFLLSRICLCKEIQEKRPESNGSALVVDYQIQKERSKSLSMFGTLVSPKLRAGQLSFEMALDTLVEIANMRSSILSAYDQVRNDMESTRG